MNGQSAAKPLSTLVYEEGSTTIPVMGSTEEYNSLGKGSNYYIYILIDPRNKKIRYVGQTLNLKERFRKHLSEAKTYISYTAKDNWIRKLLSLNLKPILKVIDGSQDRNKILELEIFHIKKFKENNIILYNSTDGGDGTSGDKFKKSILQYSLKGEFIKEYKGVSQTARLLNINPGILSSALNGKFKYCAGYIWRHKEGNEIPLNISPINYKGSKFVNQYDLQGNFIKQWFNQIEAANFYKVDRSAIGNCCLGKSKSSCGYIWKYNN